MSNAGSNIFPIETVKDRNHCICGQDSCPQIRACFHSIGDARGSILLLPHLGGSRNAAVKEYKLKRTCHHLGLGEGNFELYASVDRRDRRSGAPPKPVSQLTRGAMKNNPERKKKCIATHHFHPQVVQRFLIDKRMSYLDYLPESFVMESGLWQNGYTEDDYFPTEYKVKGKSIGRVFVPVPTYNNALEDYQQAAIRYSLDDIIKSCNDATRGPFLRQHDDEEEDTLKPVNKIGKFSMSAQDLQRAVCVLAADVEQLKLSNIRLEEANKGLEQQLEMEKSRNANGEDIFQGSND